jgi:hypothetical protein
MNWIYSWSFSGFKWMEKSQMGNQEKLCRLNQNKSDQVTFCFFGGSSGFIGLEIVGLFSSLHPSINREKTHKSDTQ